MATVDDPVEEKPIKTAMRPTLRRRVGYPKKINETKCDSGGPIATRRWPEAALSHRWLSQRSKWDQELCKKTFNLIAHCIGQRNATVSVEASEGIFDNTEWTAHPVAWSAFDRAAFRTRSDLPTATGKFKPCNRRMANLTSSVDPYGKASNRWKK